MRLDRRPKKITTGFIRCAGSMSLLALAVLLAGCPGKTTSPTAPVPTAIPIQPTATSVLTSTPTSTGTPTPTRTPTPSPTVTDSATATSSPTVTQTFTPTGTATITPTATASSTSANSPTPTGSPTITATSTNTPTCQIGLTATFAGDNNTSGYGVLLFPYQAPSTGSIYSMTGELLSAGGSSYYYQYGVYADDGSGNPTNLLGSTAITSFPAATESTENLSFGSAIAITAGNTYWLAFFGNVALVDDNSTNGQYREINVAGGPTPMPSTASSISGLATLQPVFYLYGTTCP